MGNINYVVGDATLPQVTTNTIIAHICNDVGVFGAGFVVALAERYPTAKKDYLSWAKIGIIDGLKFELGKVQFVKVKDALWVANMVAQKGVGFRNGPPIRYEALEEALEQVARFAKKENASVVGPRFGSGLAGGSWPLIETIIERKLCQQNVEVTICDLGQSKKETPDARPVFGW